jgi:hypothetical protein
MELIMVAAQTKKNSAKDDRLIHELVDRYRKGQDSPDLPLIVENQVKPTKTVHLLVVWDKWADLQREKRAQIIIDAFATCNTSRQQSAVTIPMGLTSSEALSMGFLPYRIEPAVRKSDKVPETKIKQAMDSVGGVSIQVGKQRQLRFATQAQAQEAFRRLLQQIAKPIWTLVQETAGGDSV